MNEMASFLFHQGTNYNTYRYLGVHREEGGISFRVWAPNADSVSLVGSFNDWNVSSHPLNRITEKGVFEIVTGDAKEGDLYKYYIKNGEKECYKADPYGISMQCPPETASVVSFLPDYAWGDDGWMKFRQNKFTRENVQHQPVNIYEIHAGSWKKREDGGFYNYVDLAHELVPYAKSMGYTHIELMPIAEHPFGGSWGYQICGYYAPTARYGTARDFMEFVDIVHNAGMGVILDWVPAHFPKDAHGLYEFDGQPLYEYQGKDRMEHAGWGTRRFDVGREEVQSFLISNAIYWAREYHIDGLRVDAVASMLYLDYDKKPGEWVPNIYGDNKCLEAISFFKKLNGALEQDCPAVMTIAEESTAFGGVTDKQGLNFTLKWNMGWMNDSLSYLSEDPLWRCDHHEKMTFAMTYAFSERYVLPVSHDEVVHGKKSLLDRCVGPYEQKFSAWRTFLLYQYAHPGKKLNFMGNEIAQFTEWDYEKSVEWFLLDYDMHKKAQYFAKQLGWLYLCNPPLWEKDDSWDGFHWIDADNRRESIYSFVRRDSKGKELIVLLNFLPVKHEKYLIPVNKTGRYREIFNTDDSAFGGGGCVNPGDIKTTKNALYPKTRVLSVDVPPMGGIVLERVGK